MLLSEGNADNLLTYEEFYRRCTERGYGEFALGETIELDVTDFSKVDYEAVFQRIREIGK